MAASHEPIKQLAKQVLKDGQGLLVLDLGCGNGMLLRRIALETGATPFGLELDESKARYAHRLLRRFGGEVKTANIFTARWPWPDQVFDLAIVPLTAFLDAPHDLSEQLRVHLMAHAHTILAYAYDDDRQRLGALSAMAERIGIQLLGPTLDETASLAQFVKAGVQATSYA